ncbi:ionotropic receptor 75a-like isoform X1 [Vespula pensylvanica]|uniref:ionotropic receptor 75a-like isoform X1 n=1 Tax=Vespula pensylvanica TaxID=30213 RepID=UPI001CBA4B2D|nr:ionotropic receptor 75a-like isoform X1 [Vespula pensylvanica]
MYTKSFLHFQLVFLVFAQNNEIIRDYFIYKRIPAVVGFSCGNITNDFQMIKMLNDVGISVSIKGPSAEFNFLRFLNVNYWKLGVFVDLRCQDQNATVIFDKSSDYRMYDYAYNWFVLAPNISYCLRKLNDTAFSVITDFVVSVPNYDYYELYDIYNPNKERGGILNITRYAIWNEAIGLKVFLLETKILRRWNFHKLKVIVAGALEQKPENASLLEYLEDHDNVNLEDWPKIGFTLVQLLTNIFNFSLHAKAFTTWTDYTNGPLMDSLIDGSVDIGYQPSLIIHRRLDFAKVLMEIMPARTCFMFLTLPSTTIQFSSILRPLAWNSWYMIFFFFIICSSVFSFITKLDRIENKDYGSSLLTTLGAICQQGAQNTPFKFASRIALFQIGVYGLLIYNYYSAAIVSARLNIPLNKLNDSLYKLVASKMKLGSENTVVTNIILQDHNPEMIYFKNYWLRIPQQKKIMSVEKGVIKMMHGGFAYHSIPEHAYYYINNYFDQKMICQLTEIHWLRPTTVALYTNRKGHYHEVGKIGLMKIFSTGLLKRELKRTFAQKPYCQNDGNSVESVTIYEAAPIIILLICGITISIIICLIENIIFRMIKTKQFSIIKKYKLKLMKKI